jgi:drug/metabolite transporter (DMT)-like permease
MNTTRLIGILLCLIGVLVLLSQGSFEKLLSFKFGVGDLWVIASGLSFAIYSVLVRKKPASISSLHFLMLIFGLGTIMLFPFFIIENIFFTRPQFSPKLFATFCYLGLGTSVISFLSWNVSIQKLGISRTVLFGNLIPIFSTIEAVIFLGEKITKVHIISGLIVIAGLIIANFQAIRVSQLDSKLKQVKS